MKGIRRNAIFGFLGFAIPTMILFLAYPVMVRHLGTEGFGVFVLATSFSGVLAFLDLGVAAATTRFVAEDVSKKDLKSAADVIVVSVLFYGALGAVLAILIWVLSPWLVSLFSIHETLRSDATWAFRLASIQFAAFMLFTVYVSLFKGLHRFDRASFLLVVLSVLTYGGVTAAILFGGAGLVGTMAISMGANLLVLVLATALALSSCHAEQIVLRYPESLCSVFRRMVGFGSLMALNSICGVFLYQIQRYLITALIGPAAVAVYQVATTVPAKAHAVVNSITEVMFPLASAERDLTNLRRAYLRMLMGSGLVALSLLTPLALFAEPLMKLWLGAELGAQAAPLLPIFALAFFFLALSPAPYHLVNGVGKPWLNTASYAFNAAMNIIMVAIFARDGITLAEFAWAFAIANTVNGLLYQLVVENTIWRRDLLLPASIRAPKGGRA